MTPTKLPKQDSPLDLFTKSQNLLKSKITPPSNPSKKSKNKKLSGQKTCYVTCPSKQEAFNLV